MRSLHELIPAGTTLALKLHVFNTVTIMQRLESGCRWLHVKSGLPITCRLRLHLRFWTLPQGLRKQQSSRALSTPLQALPCQLRSKRNPGIRLLLLPPCRLQMAASQHLPACRVLAVHLGGMTAGMLCWLTAVHLAQQVALTALLHYVQRLSW